MKAFWVVHQMIDLDLFFRYLKGRCHGNRFCEKWQLPSVVALTLGNRMGYLYLNVRIFNSVNDGSKSCKNFVNFGPVNSRVDSVHL